MTAYIFVITAWQTRSSELQTLALVPTPHEAWASKCWSSDPWRLAKSWNPFSWSLGLRKPANICWTGYLLTVHSSKIHLALSRVPQSYVALHPSSDEANDVTILVLLKTNANPTPVRQVWNRSRCSAADFKLNYTFTHSVPLVWHKCTCHSTQLFSPGSWFAPSDLALHHLGRHNISVSHGFRFLSLSSQLAFLMRSVLAPLLLFQETYKELDKAISVTSPFWLQSKVLTNVVLFGHPKQAPPWRSRWSTAPKSHVAWQD